MFQKNRKILETLKTKLNKDLTGIQITENFKVILKNYFIIFQEIDSLLEHTLIIYTKLQNNYENLNYIYDQFEFHIECNVERDFIENHKNTIGKFIATNKRFNLNIRANRVCINLKKTIGHIFARSEIFIPLSGIMPEFSLTPYLLLSIFLFFAYSWSKLPDCSGEGELILFAGFFFNIS